MKGSILIILKNDHKFVECPEEGSWGHLWQKREDRISNLYEKMFPYADSVAKLDSSKNALEAQWSLDSGN